eukprot:6205380-Pleurochrysis_carterae.AAC.3
MKSEKLSAHREGGRLEAQLINLVVLAAGQGDGSAAALNLRAGVGKASTLDLVVSQRRDVGASERASKRALRSSRQHKRSSKRGSANLGGVARHHHRRSMLHRRYARVERLHGRHVGRGEDRAKSVRHDCCCWVLLLRLLAMGDRAIAMRARELR